MLTSNAQISRVRALVFDLDGTLIDSKLDLVLAVNATMIEMHRPELDHDVIASYVGNGAPVLIKRALGPSAAEHEAAQALDYFLRYYRAHMLDNTIAYPGVKAGLEALHKTPMAVLTNKPVRVSKSILEGLGLAKYFRAVYGGNSFETKKPDPQGMLSVLRELNVDARESMMVGDSDVDVQTARNASAWACGVTYGFGPHGFEKYPPDITIDNLEELAPIINGNSR